MTTYATNLTPYAAPPRDRGGPLAATVAGAIAAFLALALLAGGAALLWVSSHKTDADGYYTSATHSYSTPTRALTTQNLDVDLDAPDWAVSSLGRVRIAPRSSAADTPVFVGIARTRDVDAYLDGVQRDEVTDLELDPFRLDRSRLAGEGRPAMPAAQTFWAASSTNGRPLDWKVRDGDWSVVMMNADGSPGVHVDAAVAGTVPLIRDLGWWLLVPGIALGAIATLLVVLGLRGLTRPAPRPAVPAVA